MTDNTNIIPYTKELQCLAQNFASGNDYLDRFLKSEESLTKYFGKTFVYVSEDNSHIIGYYNLGVGYIEQINNSVRYKLGGAIHINCFALDQKYHGLLQGYDADGQKINLSDVLLSDCLDRIHEMLGEKIGYAFVTLNSTQEGHSLYERNDFSDLEEDMNFSAEKSDVRCIPMYYSLQNEEFE
ncbi:MAG: N-acetyltransferase [Eubacteriales bacterium]|nr:N-acetyltransferase [Eubacteriales bacterium]